MTRCVNLDWLEVHAREPLGQPRDAFYYASLGFSVRRRDYGTRVYREMFTILDTFEEPLLEVRRDPASKGIIGIHDENECHLRLCNRTCYFDNAADFFRIFLEKHGYTDIRISRVDICLDFTRFDKGDYPQAFVRRYMQHRYAKINQGRIAGHGEDTWSGQEWNSLKWGSLKSLVTTKLYNKTMELYNPKLGRYGKPYIREAWRKSGLIDDIEQCTLNGEKVDVWRVEFSMISGVKNWIRLELDGKDTKFHSLKNNLETYKNRERILVMFASLARHYFRFKKYEEGKRKDRCDDKILFDFSGIQEVYKIGKNNTALGSGENYKSKFSALLNKIRAYQECHSLPEIRKACDILIGSITEENMRSDLANPWSRDELEFLKELIHQRTTNKDWSYEVAVAEVQKLLNISERVLPNT